MKLLSYARLVPEISAVSVEQLFVGFLTKL